MKGDKREEVWGEEERRSRQTEGLLPSSLLSPPLVDTVREDGGQFNRSVEQKVEREK